MAISLADMMAKRLAAVHKDGALKCLRPDGKTQVTVEYGESWKPKCIDTAVVFTQHDSDVALEQIHKDMTELVIKAAIPTELLDDSTKIFVNPTGCFGSPQGDSGLTGRKIIVDTYGGSATPMVAEHPLVKIRTKVDRSAAYAARYVAKNIVAAGLADKCQMEFAYAIHKSIG